LTVRGNPLKSSLTDYQLAVYFMVSFFNAAFLGNILLKEISTPKKMSSLTAMHFCFRFLFLLYIGSITGFL